VKVLLRAPMEISSDRGVSFGDCVGDYFSHLAAGFYL
jgi:hypothetical protein